MKRIVVLLSLISCWASNSCAWAQNLNIVSTTPAANSINIASGSTIGITFDLNIDASTLTGSSILVRGSHSGVLDGVLTGGGSNTIIFNAENDFRAGEIISVTITRALLSESGFNLPRGHTYSFTAITKPSPSSSTTFAQRRVNFTSASSTTDDITALDFDRDGDLDLIVGRDVPTVEQTDLWVNDGNRGFCPRVACQ